MARFQHDVEEMNKLSRRLSPPQKVSHDGYTFWLTKGCGERTSLGEYVEVALLILKQMQDADEELLDKYRDESRYGYEEDDWPYDYDPYYDDDSWHNSRDDLRYCQWREESEWDSWFQTTIIDARRCGDVVRPEWLSDDVLCVTAVMERESGWRDAPVLADALEDAGCDDVNLLGALRTHENDQTETHLWIVELIRLAAQE